MAEQNFSSALATWKGSFVPYWQGASRHAKPGETG